MSVLYFSEAYPTQSGDQTLFGSLSIRRLVFATGEVDSYAGVDHSQDNSSGYVHIGGEGGTTDGGVETAEFVYPMSFAVVDVDAGGGGSLSADMIDSSLQESRRTQSAGIHMRGGEGSDRHTSGSEESSEESRGLVNSGYVLAEEEVAAFDTLIIADHSSHSVRRVFAFMDTAAPSSLPTVYVPPTTSAPTAVPGSSGDAAGGSSGVKIAGILLFSFSFLCCGVCILWVFFVKKRKKHDRAAGDVEMSASHSSANLLTFASYNARKWFYRGREGGGGPQYEEMDSSNASRDVEADCAFPDKKWADISPSSEAATTDLSGSCGSGAGGSLFSRWAGKQGGGGGGLDREREIAVHSLLDVSDSSCEED
jgi:hypothetical protein